MGQVPQRLEAMRKAAAEARIIRPGDKARITTGAMAGWIVDVADIHAGVASFIGNMLGKTSINIPLEHLEKIQPVAKPHNIG
jgi:hypothetical protein